MSYYSENYLFLNKAVNAFIKIGLNGQLEVNNVSVNNSNEWFKKCVLFFLNITVYKAL